MARPLRIEYPGAVHHVTSRGKARQAIFREDRDRKSFLDVLASMVEEANWLCHAYCLMENHYHLVKGVEEYPWSSYRATVGRASRPPFLSVDWVLGQCGNTIGKARARYRDFVRGGMCEVSG